MKDKGFYKSFFAMYIVLVLQNVITLSVNLADNIMLGAYSETALSGVAAVNQIQFIFQQLMHAVGDGMVIICSQYWGKKHLLLLHLKLCLRDWIEHWCPEKLSFQHQYVPIPVASCVSVCVLYAGGERR